MNKNEKTAKANINTYQKSTMFKLTDAYNKPSSAKSAVWSDCLRDMVNNTGWGLKILTYNTFMFTCGYLFTDKETGVIKFKYFTPNHTTIVDL